MKPPKPLPRLSEKRRAALKGRPIYSTIKKKKRSKSEKERIYGPPGYVEWLHTLPCVACKVVGYSECAHVGRYSGVGRKGDWTETVPLCGICRFQAVGVTGCHQELHEDGRLTFEGDWGINLEAEAKRNHASWLADSGRGD